MEKTDLVNDFLVPEEILLHQIFLFRGEKVMLDRDLADLYGVETKQLKRAVRRNQERFPKDFMFELNEKEVEILRCQIGTSSWGGTRYAPMAFTELGIAMLSSVLKSPGAIQVNIQIMRAFTRMRKVLGSQKELEEKLNKLESRIGHHDQHINSLFEYLQHYLEEKDGERTKVGFKLKES